MTSLECPVCLEVPRVGAGPIFGCRNGHLLCQNCVEKVKECPTCREKEIRCRNLFAERYIEQGNLLRDIDNKTVKSRVGSSDYCLFHRKENLDLGRM